MQRAMQVDSRSAAVARPALSSTSGAENEQIEMKFAHCRRCCASLVDVDEIMFRCDVPKIVKKKNSHIPNCFHAFPSFSHIVQQHAKLH